MTTRLTAHFALEELAATQHREIDNRPPPEVVATLRTTAALIRHAASRAVRAIWVSRIT